MRYAAFFVLCGVLGAGAATFEVSTNGPLYSIASVPWHTLSAGDTVLIHWRSTPYNEKWVLCRQGLSDAPITIRGVPNKSGDLPVIDGRDATTPAPLNFWGEQRGVIKIGGANTPSDTTPEHIVIENLEIRSARPPYQYVGDDNTTNTYANNAAAIYIEKGRHITIRNCILQDCGNGFFAGAFGGVSSNVLVEGCRIFGNGISNSIYEHNIYTEVSGITFQHNDLGPLRQGCLGNNLKDRSAGTVIRYNRIENGNRQLDLVDSDTLRPLPLYSNTFVYGNLLIESTNDGNRQIVHYGGDSGITAQYRKGRLHFFNNTVVSKRSDRTTLFRLSTNEEQADCAGNILYVTLAGNTLAMLDDTGALFLRDNWTKPGCVGSHGSLGGTITDSSGNITSSAPGFVDEATDNYRLTNDSSCVDAHTNAPNVKPDYDGVPRPLDGNNSGIAEVDIGAFEYVHPAADTDGDGFLDWMEIRAGTDPTNSLSLLKCVANQSAGDTHPVVSWASESNKLYSIERASSLSLAFTAIATNLPAAPPLNVHTDATAGAESTLFYRVAVE